MRLICVFCQSLKERWIGMSGLKCFKVSQFVSMAHFLQRSYFRVRVFWLNKIEKEKGEMAQQSIMLKHHNNISFKTDN